MKILPKDELRISITSFCNMNCVYCHNEGNFIKKSLNLEEIRKIVDIFIKYNLKSIRITGGEPLIHPQILEICRMLKDEYHLKIGINTNLVEYDKLVRLIEENLVDRVVVGLDYFDKEVSKNSIIGLKSSIIKKRLINLKRYLIDITVSTVFDGDIENIVKLTDFCIKNDIRIKILEQVSLNNDEFIHDSYIRMKEFITKKFNLNLLTEDRFYGQDQGYNNGKRLVSFLHSLHYLKNCHYCKNLPYRVSADEKIHSCLFKEGTSIFDQDKLDKFLKREGD